MNSSEYTRWLDVVRQGQDQDRKDYDRPDCCLDLSATIATLERELGLPAWKGPDDNTRRYMERTLDLLRKESARG